jgi:hypothetical protein
VRAHHPAYERLKALPVGESFVWPRTGEKFVIYVSNFGRRVGKRFRTRRIELGRRVQRLA